ncbi:12946_t:CDS:2, partial [Gigaspora rosea]
NVLYGHSFKPEARGGHMATLRPIANNSLVWSQTHQYNLSDEVFYLDLSSRFNIDSPPFTDLSDISRMPFGSEKGSTVLGDSGQRIYLVSGVQQNMATFNYNASDSTLWIYTINSQHWHTSGPGTHGTLLPRRRSTSTIINSKNVIYIFGGRVELDTGSSVLIIYEDLFTFDTNKLEWKNLSLPNHPSKRRGVTQNNPGGDSIRILMTEIYIFDTVQSTWFLQTANSPVNIGPRVGHTAVLAPDKHTIVILGGTQSNITNDFGPPTNTSANIYLMNLSNPSNYAWVTQFGPPPGVPLIAIIISLAVGVIIGIVIGIIIIAWRNRNPRRVNEPLVGEPPN